MFGSSPPALGAAPDTATMVLPAWPCAPPADARPAGTMVQLAGQGAWLVATPKRRVFRGGLSRWRTPGISWPGSWTAAGRQRRAVVRVRAGR